MNVITEYASGVAVPFAMGFDLTDATRVEFGLKRADGTTVLRDLQAADWNTITTGQTLNVSLLDGEITRWGYYVAQLHVTKANLKLPSDKVLISVKKRVAVFGA